MNFIDQLSSPMNMLTDGQLTCTYLEIPEIFASIQKVLAIKNINIEDCLILACDNSVPSALILLYLLEKGHSFLLLPKGSQTPQGTQVNQFLPTFCRYQIEAKNVNENDEKAARLNPQQFLHVVENEKWTGNRHNSTQKLYLRTSGSTGFPKMAMHSHQRLRNNALNCVQRLGIKSDDKIAIPVPLFHMFGLGAAFLPAVAVGASIDLQKGANILRYLQREREFNPNMVFMTPVFCEILLKGRRSPRPYKLTVTAGDRFRGDTFAQYESLCGCLVQLYGSTEMGAIAAASPDMPIEVRAKTAGKPMANVQMRVVEGADDTKDFGKLWCSHQHGFEGYVDEHGNSISLGQVKQGNWFDTKDLGRIGPEGYLEILGRTDHSVNRDGLLVFFADIEKAIEKITGVESVVVISKEEESQRGKKLIAYCVLVKGANITGTDIRTSCFELLPRRAVPDTIILVDSLPLLPNGKVDRQKLVNLVEKVC